MKPEELTNARIWATDFAAEERQTFLKKYGPAKKLPAAYLASGLPTAGIWMTDISITDGRSIKAQLTGSGSWRAAWWNLNYAFHLLLHPGSNLEQAMVSFHRRHHLLTLFTLQWTQDFKEVVEATRRHGLMAGMRCAIGQIENRERT